MMWEMILVDFQGCAVVFVFRCNDFLSVSHRGVVPSGDRIRNFFAVEGFVAAKLAALDRRGVGDVARRLPGS